MFNPIVIFIFYFGLAASAIGLNSWIELLLFGLIVFLLVLINHKRAAKVIKQITPYLYFLPIFFGIYFVVSIFFTDYDLIQIINSAGLALFRLLLLLTIMSIYIDISKESNIVHALRSLWSKTNIAWRWVDNLFIYLELTLRFYPSFQFEWNTVNRSKKALGLEEGSKKWDKVKSIANDLPGIIIQNYLKAENTASIMKQRGYGKVIPRGVAYPIPFRIIDLFTLIIIIGTFWMINNYVSL